MQARFLGLPMKKTLALWLDSDVGHSFRTSPVAMLAAAIALVCVFCSIFAGWVSPHNPFDLAALELGDARLPPAWEPEGTTKYLLGTDDQGRDILSALIYGARISLVVGMVSVLLSVMVGVLLGLLAGFWGGWLDAFLMRVCDVMLSFPPILVALLIAGVGRALFPNAHDTVAFGVLIISIGPGAGAGHHTGRYRDHHGGDAVLPGRWRAADLAFAGHADPRRQRLPVLGRMVDHRLPRLDADPDRIEREPSGRLAARRPQPETEMRPTPVACSLRVAASPLTGPASRAVGRMS
jgi:ABC-type proline/glycine betaine transport system permease subunit